MEIPATIDGRLRLAASRFPRAPAVVDGGTVATYADLDARAAAVASAVASQVPAGGTVALWLEPGIGLIAASLGILRAGAACVPLDPAYPEERNAYVVAHCGAGAIVTDAAYAETAGALSLGGRPVLHLDSLADRPPVPCPAASAPESLAYVIYTSGSTGRPKGVYQTHRNLLHHVDNFARALQIGPGDRLSLLYSPAFAASLMDIYGALTNGAAVHPYALRRHGLAALAGWLERERISVLHAVPTVFRGLSSALPPGRRLTAVRAIDLGGESVTRRDVETFRERFAPGCRLVNHLAFTEASVAAQFPIDHATRLDEDVVPVGFAPPGVEILLHGEDGREVAGEEVGEIVVRSPYLSPGYRGDPGLTAAAFVPDPAGGGGRLYRSGDLGRRRPDGALVHLGRKDFRVKILGQSVEVAEVEAALHALPAVRDAAVVGRPDAGGVTRLVAYVIPAAGTRVDGAALRASLASTLPAAMLPSSFVPLEALPLTPSGKVDRRALPAAPGLPRREAAPRDRLEVRLTTIWEEVLGVRPIGVHDDFFDLGGNSLRAVDLVSRIGEIDGKKLPLAFLIEAPTIALQAERLRRTAWSPPWPTIVPLQSEGDGPPFFCAPGAGSDVLALVDFARHSGREQPFYGLQAPGQDQSRAPLHSVRRLAAAFVRGVVAVQPVGPYFLGGASYGGLVAFEMAQQLMRRGERIALLALFDAYGPGYPRLRWTAPWRFRWFGWLGTPLPQPPERTWQSMREEIRVLRAHRWRTLRCRLRGRPLPLENLYLRFREVAFRARRRYHARPYPGRITLFRLRSQPAPEIYHPDPELGWHGLAIGGIEVVDIDGTHGTQFERPWVEGNAAKLRERLAAARRANLAPARGAEREPRP